MFPGLTHKIQLEPLPGFPRKRRRLTIVVHNSGKCIITGSASKEEREAAWSRFFLNDLCRFRSSVQYGSSGNYRTSQTLKRGHTESNWMHQMMVSTKRPREMSAMDDDEELLAASLTEQIRAVKRARQHIRELGSLAAPESCGDYQPGRI